MSMKRMATLGHYRPPHLSLPGAYNKPGVGRVGKSMPAFKRSRPLPKVKRD